MHNDLNIMHRDLHLKNVMLMFKIDVTEEDLESPDVFFKQELPMRLEEAVSLLSDESTFDIKIIDFGLSRFDDEENLNTLTKGLGVRSIAPPEMD